MNDASKTQFMFSESAGHEISCPASLDLRSWLSVAAGRRANGLVSRAIAALLLVPALPAIALAVLLVRCTSPGPAIYRQVRLGARGTRFVMYKVRTMVADAEAKSGPVWASRNDPRVTALGRLLRAIGWDELPQLFNILKGDMAFVGPRPERPEIAESLAGDIPGYYGRVAVRPGITGLAQINLSADTQLDDVRKKLQLDLEYIQQAGPLLDLRIVMATLPRLFGLRSEKMVKLLGVWRAAPQEPVVYAMRISAGRSGAQRGRPAATAIAVDAERLAKSRARPLPSSSVT